LIDFDRLGEPPPYCKTYDFSGEYINTSHKFYAECPAGRLGIPVCIDIGIDGCLQRWMLLSCTNLPITPGDILELGTHKGLSTTIIALARHRRRGHYGGTGEGWSLPCLDPAGPPGIVSVERKAPPIAAASLELKAGPSIATAPATVAARLQAALDWLFADAGFGRGNELTLIYGQPRLWRAPRRSRISPPKWYNAGEHYRL
jgi:hypothetical protein